MVQVHQQQLNLANNPLMDIYKRDAIYLNIRINIDVYIYYPSLSFLWTKIKINRYKDSDMGDIV